MYTDFAESCVRPAPTAHMAALNILRYQPEGSTRRAEGQGVPSEMQEKPASLAHRLAHHDNRGALLNILPTAIVNIMEGNFETRYLLPSWSSLGLLSCAILGWTGIWFSNRVIPHRRQASFIARNKNTIVVGTIMALIGGLIGAVIKAIAE